MNFKMFLPMARKELEKMTDDELKEAEATIIKVIAEERARRPGMETRGQAQNFLSDAFTPLSDDEFKNMRDVFYTVIRGEEKRRGLWDE